MNISITIEGKPLCISRDHGWICSAIADATDVILTTYPADRLETFYQSDLYQELNKPIIANVRCV